MEFPNELRYTKTHEWVRIDGNRCVVGITDFAVEQLNKEIVNVDLPEIDETARRDEAFGILDAVKAAFDLNAPVSGRIAEVNTALREDPTLCATSPYGDGWMIEIEIDDPAEVESLMDAEAYQAHIESEHPE
jgi:glycine cleavage system H protein